MWRAISSTWDTNMSGARWTIGNGKSILFWRERLVPYGNIVLKSSPAAYSGRVVLTFVYDFVNADVNHLSWILSLFGY